MKSVVFPVKKPVEFLEMLSWKALLQVGLLSCSKKSAESSTPAEWNLTTMYFPNIWVPVCGRAIKILLGGKGTKLFARTHGNSIRMKNGFLRIY